MSPHFGKFVAYFRVSTDRQGKSGLGLDAQREAVMGYLNGGKWTLIAEFTEVESGKRDDNRPQLAAAIAACKKLKAKLVIAKLDRLSRNLAFIAALMDSGIDHPRRQSACYPAYAAYSGGRGRAGPSRHCLGRSPKSQRKCTPQRTTSNDRQSGT